MRILKINLLFNSLLISALIFDTGSNRPKDTLLFYLRLKFIRFIWKLQLKSFKGYLYMKLKFKFLRNSL